MPPFLVTQILPTLIRRKAVMEKGITPLFMTVAHVEPTYDLSKLVKELGEHSN